MFMSKHQDLQKILFGEIVFDNDFRKIKKTQDDAKDNDDFNNGKICTYGCVSVCMYVCVYYIMHCVCTYIYIHTCVYTNIYIHMYIHTYTYICIYIHIHMYPYFR